VLAWERARLVNPYDRRTRENLAYVRGEHLLGEPEPAWYEACAGWLPMNAWVWVASVSLWIAIAASVLPGILRRRRADWQQVLAAAALAVLLLALPACLGTHARTRLSVVLARETVVRLTPTRLGESVGRLSAGEMARMGRRLGEHVHVTAGGGLQGWVLHQDLGRLIGE
jgi:hypothetical protein